MHCRWCIIQVDMISTKLINPHFASNGEYWCVFLATHMDNNKRSHKLSRWWPEWYKYTRFKKTGDIIYGNCAQIRPSTILCSTEFIRWAILLPLFNNNAVTLVGPFNFEPISTSNRVKQKMFIEINGISYRKFVSLMESFHQQREQGLVTRYHILKAKIAKM